MEYSETRAILRGIYHSMILSGLNDEALDVVRACMENVDINHVDSLVSVRAYRAKNSVI